MNPLTPDHHFYVDQGTNARLRLVAIAIGRKLVEAGTLGDPEDVVYLHYNELRLLMADPSAFDAQDAVSERRDAGEAASERRPPSWVGTATQVALDFPYARSGASPTRSRPASRRPPARCAGSARSPGVVEGTARYVASLDEFGEVKEGRSSCAA